MERTAQHKDPLSREREVVTSDHDAMSKVGGCSCCVHKFQTPSGIMVAGASQSGKSQLVSQILQERYHMFTQVPKEVIYVYSVWDPKFDVLQSILGGDVTFRTDIPTSEELQGLHHRSPVPRVLVLDDQIGAFKDDQLGRDIVKLATVLTHHCNLSVFYITQNLFHGQIQREIGLQCQYLIVFSNARCHNQIRTLGSQVFGKGQLDYFTDAYRRATSRPHGFLLIDLHQQTPEKHKLKSHILPSEELIVYLRSK
jgi:hypothetical protein